MVVNFINLYIGQSFTKVFLLSFLNFLYRNSKVYTYLKNSFIQKLV